jgi:hypothetical protein
MDKKLHFLQLSDLHRGVEAAKDSIEELKRLPVEHAADAQPSVRALFVACCSYSSPESETRSLWSGLKNLATGIIHFLGGSQAKVSPGNQSFDEPGPMLLLFGPRSAGKTVLLARSYAAYRKPDNVLLRDQAFKISDFGIATGFFCRAKALTACHHLPAQCDLGEGREEPTHPLNGFWMGALGSVATEVAAYWDDFDGFCSRNPVNGNRSEIVFHVPPDRLTAVHSGVSPSLIFVNTRGAPILVGRCTGLAPPLLWPAQLVEQYMAFLQRHIGHLISLIHSVLRSNAGESRVASFVVASRKWYLYHGAGRPPRRLGQALVTGLSPAVLGRMCSSPVLA